MTEIETIKWIVGLDLRVGTERLGASAVAEWLSEHAESVELTVAHVVEMPGKVEEHGYDQNKLEAAARAATSEALADSSMSDMHVHLVHERSPEDALEHLRHSEGAFGIIVGRRAPRGEDPYIRLGRTARLLLRRLTAPIIVTPPRLAVSEIGRGPIVAAVDTGGHSLAAVELARDMGRRLGREVVVAHVEPAVDPHVGYYVSPDGLDRIEHSKKSAAQSRFRNWATEHGISERLEFHFGDVVEGVMAVAEYEDACLVVCGSRKLGTIERIFSSSVGAHLAAVANRPVLVTH